MRPFNYTPEQMRRLHGTHWMNAPEFYTISEFYPLVTRRADNDNGSLGFYVAATSESDAWNVQLMLAALRAYDRQILEHNR